MGKFQTAKALHRLAMAEGRPWPEILQEYAERGFTWDDAADYVGVPTANLKAFCHRRNLTFPWQGHQSPILREHMRRTMIGRTNTRTDYPTYTAFGVTDTLPKLAKRFGATHKITYETLRRRIKAGMDPETALTTPLMDPTAKAIYANRCRRKERTNHWEPQRDQTTTATRL